MFRGHTCCEHTKRHNLIKKIDDDHSVINGFTKVKTLTYDNLTLI